MEKIQKMQEKMESAAGPAAGPAEESVGTTTAWRSMWTL